MACVDCAPTMSSPFPAPPLSPVPIGRRFLRHDDGPVASDSERWMLELVRRAGVMSRADLTRASGLSVPGAKSAFGFPTVTSPGLRAWRS